MNRATPPPETCPCGSGRPFGDCCGPFLAGAALPPTAEALMRSRYTAYGRGDAAYLAATWDPATRPAELTLEPGLRWLGLTVSARERGGEGDDQGWVEFTARYRAGGRAGRLRERSRFRRREGRWYYVDGVHAEAQGAKVGRNAPCSCGSGRKYKRCCGRE